MQREREVDGGDGLDGVTVLLPRLPVIAWSAQDDGTLAFLSPQAEGFAGEPTDRLVRSWRRRVHRGDVRHLVRAFRRARRDGRPFSVDVRIERADGAYVWHECRASRTLEPRGAWVGVLIDVSARKAAEVERERACSTLRSMLEAAPAVILSLDRDARIRFVNRAVPPLELEEVIGTDALAYVPEGARERVRGAIDRVFTTGSVEEVETEGPPGLDGAPRFYLTRLAPVLEDGRVVAASMCALDITDRRLAQRALARNEERHHTLLELIPDGIFMTSGGVITYANARFARLVGLESPAQAIGRSPLEFVVDGEHAEIRAALAALGSGQAQRSMKERTLRRVDGRNVHVLSMVTRTTDDGQSAFIVALQDLTDKDRSEQLLRSVLESVPDAIVTIDERGVVESTNPALTRLFGYAADELVGQNVSMLAPDELRLEHNGFIQAYLETGQAKIIGKGRTVKARRKDGTLFDAELTITPFQLDGARHFTGVVRDITDRRRLEEQFRQAHKMEAFGQLAGGVAHDFNNLLTVILGEAEALLGLLPPGDPRCELVANVVDAGERAASLTRQLLTFSRQSVVDPRVLDVNAVVRGTEKMLRRLIGEDVTLHARLGEGLPPVDIDPGQLGQVLMNLAVNARDAMPEGGELRIETEAATLSEDDVAARPSARLGSHVRVTVSDTGCGMTDDVRRRVFQPFFTTKEVGKGSGLGLAVVHGIVTQSGGYVELSSAPGQGTRFEIYLPAASRLPASDERASAGPEVHRGETVLVVEDDEALRRLAVRTLTKHGYVVIPACDGVDALEKLESAPRDIHALVTDIIMPRMDGRALAERVRAKQPLIKVLYVSGYPDESIRRRGLERADIDLLPKPYTPVRLLRALRRTLDAPAKSAT